MPGTKTVGGYQPPTQPAERRAFFDLLRRLTELETLVAELEARLAALEP